MCGIAGVFAHGHSAVVDVDQLRAYQHAMRQRGPDGRDEWISPDRRLGLCHTRLAIIDTGATGAQPMVSASAGTVITFNGEIYNYRALRHELEKAGYVFRTNSDTEVLLNLYEHLGPAMVGRLRGMFAFALWDARQRQLFLARDAFGIKPLYYADDGATIRFASQVKALLAGKGVDTTLDPAGHAGFFLWGSVPEPYTLYRGIRSLPAGSTMIVRRDGKPSVKTFFDLRTELSQLEQSAQLLGPADARARIAAAFSDSVKHHLVADVPVGLFLSAGMDSTSIASHARALAGESIRAVTLGFEEFSGSRQDESLLAREFARSCQLQHVVKRVRYADFEASLPHVLEAMDQPSIDGVNTYFVSKAAAELGMRVALSGVGGDELFGGYQSFRAVPRTARILGFARHVPGLSAALRKASAPLVGRLSSPKYAGLLEYGGSVPGAYLLRRALFMPWELADILDPDIAREGLERLRPLEHLAATIEGISDPHLQVCALESSFYMRNQLLRDTDWAGMAHSLEIRVPFVDRELYRAILPLRINGAHAAKRDLVAAAPVTPSAEIVGRPKTGFMVPVQRWAQARYAGAHPGRGLRPWARHVYEQVDPPEVAPARTLARPIVIFRVGHLGDTLVALPALGALRRRLRRSRWVLLTNRDPRGRQVSAWDVLQPTGWFDTVISYEPSNRRIGKLLANAARLTKVLRRERPDKVFDFSADRGGLTYLRNRLFFRLVAGARGYDSPHTQPHAVGVGSSARPEWQAWLRFVGEERAQGYFSLPIPEEEHVAAHALLESLAADGSRFLAFAPGSKMPAKVWPLERFVEVGRRLIRTRSDYHVLVLGGPEDQSIAKALSESLGPRCHDLAGRLSIYGSAAVLSRCDAYFGNDTGTMHLAAMTGIPCVALFSARDQPGKWDPYGSRHIVLRHEPECAGCMLEVCAARNNECMRRIGTDEAYAALSLQLERSIASAATAAPG